MEDNVTLNDNYEYNDDQNQHEEEKNKKKSLLLLLLLLLFFIILVLGGTGLYIKHKGNNDLNIDIDGDGIAEINIDNGTGKCLVNCSIDKKKPNTNIDFKKNKKFIGSNSIGGSCFFVGGLWSKNRPTRDGRE